MPKRSDRHLTAIGVSLDAVGVMALLDHLKIREWSAADVMKAAGIGRDRFRGAMKELEAHGAVEMVRMRNSDGKMDGCYWRRVPGRSIFGGAS